MAFTVLPIGPRRWRVTVDPPVGAPERDSGATGEQKVLQELADRWSQTIRANPSTGPRSIGSAGRTPMASSSGREALIGLACYGAYLSVRRIVWTEQGRARAMRNAQRIIELEEGLGLRLEPVVQRTALRHRRLIDALNAGYAAGNVALSVGWLILLHRRGSPHFRRERRAAMVAFAGALPVFALFPTAPPRARDDHVDTLLDRGIDIEHPLLVRFYNPIAAMPSHHVAFAVVTGFGLSRRSRRPGARLGWWAYPVGVGGVVIATGNHYVLDIVAGAGLGRVGPGGDPLSETEPTEPEGSNGRIEIPRIDSRRLVLGALGALAASPSSSCRSDGSPGSPSSATRSARRPGDGSSCVPSARSVVFVGYAGVFRTSLAFESGPRIGNRFSLRSLWPGSDSPS